MLPPVSYGTKPIYLEAAQVKQKRSRKNMKYITADYHVHSTISPDGKGTMEEMCNAAIAEGIEEVAFTDHYEFYSGGITRKYFNREYLNRYFEELDKCRQIYEGRLIIRSAMEFGQLHLEPEKASGIIRSCPFDYLIGSVHKIDNIDLSQMEFREDTTQDIAGAYYSHLLELARTGDFDCLGHLDLCKRHCRKAGLPDYYDKYEDRIVQVLVALIERGKGIEVNTSGLRQSTGQTMPGLRCLKLYRELGGTVITVGSDAHRPEDVGSGFAETLSLIKEAGFDRIARYEKRMCLLRTL